MSLEESLNENCVEEAIREVEREVEDAIKEVWAELKSSKTDTAIFLTNIHPDVYRMLLGTEEKSGKKEDGKGGIKYLTYSSKIHREDGKDGDNTLLPVDYWVRISAINVDNNSVIKEIGEKHDLRYKVMIGRGNTEDVNKMNDKYKEMIYKFVDIICKSNGRFILTTLLDLSIAGDLSFRDSLKKNDEHYNNLAFKIDGNGNITPIRYMFH
ncbi:hypothetical protein CO154_02465 [Candidatus Pacearchaeota archaeon CG_4_9_14_3_um_filter_31_7]|nr:MAG: hypothetical protein COU55_00170 [Candidatus Pacearchaeota archaeon CG10_big_fil_rev_8_21_14_0_10_31_59]PJA70524.1 MAG: hypothetical protein CO154_02465 [Candidatus Pacearchaeota archaeon CG_4_9_14_3_um_filter_31_7]